MAEKIRKIINSLVIDSYQTPSLERYLGRYTAQLNPSELSVSVGPIQEARDEDYDAKGTVVTSKSPLGLQRTLSFDFILDYTGAIPHAPDGISRRKRDLTHSIKKLEKLTVHPDYDTHRPPFVRLTYGTYRIKGEAKNFSYKYTYFNGKGEPLRAKVSMSINNFSSDGTLFQSPDITKMPTVKEGDSIVKLSEEYYDDKKYYIKLANFNKMSSLRSLKKGSQFEIPPINK
tara:strand:+ start:1252 stop:1941 length:690 start_codon:yes stop_codon:yes gene_type:complete